MNIALIVLLIALIGWAGWQAVLKLRKGGGCCGEHEAAPRRTGVADRNKAHYPNEAELAVGGMTCENCARRVENALNGLEGVWATVRIDAHTARVRCKSQPDEAALREAVSGAGYVVNGFTLKTPR